MAGVCVCVCVCVCVHGQSCPTLCNRMDCSPPGSSIHGMLQKRILGMGCHFLLQGDLPNTGIELMSTCISCIGRQILYR